MPQNTHPFGVLPYARLHRDILKIAVEQDFTKLDMRTYAYLIVNVNPHSGQFYHPELSVFQASQILKMNQSSLFRTLIKFQSTGLYLREKGTYGMMGNAPHVPMAVSDAAVLKKQKSDKLLIDLPSHPFANKVFGILPREFVRIAVDENLSKFPQRHFWYICLNLSIEGHLTRLEDIETIGASLGTGSTLTMLRSFKTLHKTGLFTVKRPSTIQGIAEPVVAAMAEAEAARADKDYEKAEREFIKQQREQCKEKLNRTLHDEEVKTFRKLFREHFEATGGYLRDEDII